MYNESCPCVASHPRPGVVEHLCGVGGEVLRRGRRIDVEESAVLLDGHGPQSQRQDALRDLSTQTLALKSPGSDIRGRDRIPAQTALRTVSVFQQHLAQ